MDAVWRTPGILAIVFYMQWVARAFKKKTKKSVEEDKK